MQAISTVQAMDLTACHACTATHRVTEGIPKAEKHIIELGLQQLN